MYRPSSAASRARLSCLRAQLRAASAMLRSKCLATLYWLMILPTRTPIASCPLSLPASTRALILEVALGGRQQLLTLVRAQPGQRFIAAGHQALTGVVRRAQLEQIALIEQVHLKMPLLEQRTDRCALERRDPADAVGLAHLVDGLLRDHTPIANHDHALNAEVLAQLVHRGHEGAAVGRVALVHRHRHRAATRIGE